MDRQALVDVDLQILSDPWKSCQQVLWDAWTNSCDVPPRLPDPFFAPFVVSSNTPSFSKTINKLTNRRSTNKSCMAVCLLRRSWEDICAIFFAHPTRSKKHKSIDNIRILG